MCIRDRTVGAVLLVAAVAAIVSFAHMREVAARAGEQWRAWLLPLSVDGLVVAASMVLLTRRRAGLPGGRLAWCALLGGVGASLAANVAAAEPTATARVVAAWPALAFAVAFELLLQQRRITAAGAVGENPPAGNPVGNAGEPAPAEQVAPVLPAPVVVPVPAAERAQQPMPSPAAGEPDVGEPGAPPGRGGLEERARELLAAGGRPPGRRVLARQLGVSEHQARTVLAAVAACDTHHTNGTSGASGERAVQEGDPR